MRSEDIAPEPCEKCGGPVDVTDPQTLVHYDGIRTHYFCSCHLPENIRQIQASLNDFVNASL